MGGVVSASGKSVVHGGEGSNGREESKLRVVDHVRHLAAVLREGLDGRLLVLPVSRYGIDGIVEGGGVVDAGRHHAGGLGEFVPEPPGARYMVRRVHVHVRVIKSHNRTRGTEDLKGATGQAGTDQRLAE